MAVPTTHSLEEVTPQLLAQGLMALRGNCVMPQLVNREYETNARQAGDVIKVPIPSEIDHGEVTAAKTAPDGSKVNPTSVSIELKHWRYASFALSDKEITQSMNGVIPMQASEAIKVLANKIDSDILNEADIKSTVWVGTPGSGSNQFSSDINLALRAGQKLDENEAPPDNRRMVIDPASHYHAMQHSAFQYVSYSGTREGIEEAQINRKLGFDWYMDQNLKPRHPDTYGWLVRKNTANAYPAGTTTIRIDKTATGGGGDTKPKVGDWFTAGADVDNRYFITEITAETSATDINIRFEPGLVGATVTNDDSVDFHHDTTPLYAFHRDAIAFVSSPLEDASIAGAIIQSQTDPVSGLSLRLEISREWMQVRFTYSVLYGFAVIRPSNIIMIMA